VAKPSAAAVLRSRDRAARGAAVRAGEDGGRIVGVWFRGCRAGRRMVGRGD
jgi:hypothetical protein